LINECINQITAVTNVTEEGQKCIEAIIEFNDNINSASINVDTFKVTGRTITDVLCEGKAVRILLDRDDEKASTMHFGMPWKGISAHLTRAEAEIEFLNDIENINGEVIVKSGKTVRSTEAKDTVADLFIQKEYKSIKYNLFIPKNYDPNKKYPLIQFIHDASVCGDDPKLTLAQGLGAIVWATEEEQKKHECFVFAPQFDGEPIVDDDWNVSPKLEEAKAALDLVMEEYSIDRDRVYTTGQSMGCMSSIVLNVRYPDFFAASYLVAGQWNDRAIDGLEKQKLWMLCSQGDAKAFPIMNQMGVAMENAGARITRKVMNNNLSKEEYYRIKDEILKDNPDIIYTPLRLETVANGWHSNGGEHHVTTWKSAYGIEAIRDWLFEQRRME